MNTYNFNTKETGNILDNIKYVVDNHDILTCPTEEACVVNLFDRMFVGIPVEYLGTVVIGAFYSENTGYFLKGSDKIYFSIHDEILYLRKRF